MSGTHKTVSTGHIVAYLKEANLTHADLANLWGVADSTVSRWLKQGKAPFWTSLAIKALHKKEKSVYMCRATQKEIQVVRPVLEALGIKLFRVGDPSQ